MPIEGLRRDKSCYSSRLNPTIRVLSRGGVLENSTSHDFSRDSNSTSNHAPRGLALRWLTILPGWVITRVGPGQLPQYTRAFPRGGCGWLTTPQAQQAPKDEPKLKFLHQKTPRFGRKVALYSDGDFSTETFLHVSVERLHHLQTCNWFWGVALLLGRSFFFSSFLLVEEE